MEEKDGKRNRCLFYGVPYNPQEKMHIKEFRKLGLESIGELDCRDEDILRFMYSSHFNYKECL